MDLHLSQDPDADALLSSNPFALLVGMVLDQQVPLEWAFAGPVELQRRIGAPLDAGHVARLDPGVLSAAFSSKPALHRYPGSMATRVHELAAVVVERYDGSAEHIWADATTGAELLARVRELPGFGEQKAKIFVALLGKQLGVRPDGWEAASAPYGEPGSRRSVADITGPDSLGEVRAFKQSVKAAHKAAAAGAGTATPDGAATAGRSKRAGAARSRSGARPSPR